jgi:hypothetical protein
MVVEIVTHPSLSAAEHFENGLPALTALRATS